MNKQYVELNEATKQILKLIGNAEELFNHFGNDTPDFKSGAYWSMSMAMNYIFAYAPKYYIQGGKFRCI